MLETWTAQSSSRPSDPGGLALASISRRASSNQEADAAAADGGGGGGSGAASRGSMSVRFVYVWVGKEWQADVNVIELYLRNVCTRFDSVWVTS